MKLLKLLVYEIDFLSTFFSHILSLTLRLPFLGITDMLRFRLFGLRDSNKGGHN